MNKKGITLVEIIISIVLISIVLILLFSLLISVKDINHESKVNSSYLINKSIVIKRIEEDFNKALALEVKECDDIKKLYDGYGVNLSNGDYYFPQLPSGGDDPRYMAYNCLEFKYKIEKPTKEDKNITELVDSYAYLGIFYYHKISNTTIKSYVVSYIHDNKKYAKDLPEFDLVDFNIDSLKNKKWKYNDEFQYNNAFSTSRNMMDGKLNNIYIPIIGNDGKDYSLNLSYYKKTP